MASDLLKSFRSGTFKDTARFDFGLADLLAAERNARRPEDRLDLIRLRGWYHYQRQEFDRALAAQLEAFALKPEVEAIKNIGILARNLKDRTRAIDFLLRYEREFSEEYEFYDTLAHNCGSFGDLAAARNFGTRSLELKNKRCGTVDAPENLTQVPPFNPNPERNIIAFSLFGADPRYVEPLLVSASALPHLYPAWTIRIYLDKSVPENQVRALRAKRCQVVEMKDSVLPATFWRFLVAGDARIDRFLVRDADSILNVRERVAVDEWIASGRHFHLMRDFYTHSELILAGLWGGVQGALPSVRKLIDTWLRGQKRIVYNQRTFDQIFLRERVWPIVQQSVLAHDSVFNFGDKVDFPIVGNLPPGKHVGQNDFIFFKKPNSP